MLSMHKKFLEWVIFPKEFLISEIPFSLWKTFGKCNFWIFLFVVLVALLSRSFKVKHFDLKGKPSFTILYTHFRAKASAGKVHKDLRIFKATPIAVLEKEVAKEDILAGICNSEMQYVFWLYGKLECTFGKPNLPKVN